MCAHFTFHGSFTCTSFVVYTIIWINCVIIIIIITTIHNIITARAQSC